MMKPQRTMSPATIARKASAAARIETDPTRRGALLAVVEAAKHINGANQEYIAKVALRAQSTTVLQGALQAATVAGKVNPARWIREVLAERGIKE